MVMFLNHTRQFEDEPRDKRWPEEMAIVQQGRLTTPLGKNLDPGNEGMRNVINATEHGPVLAPNDRKAEVNCCGKVLVTEL